MKSSAVNSLQPLRCLLAVLLLATAAPAVAQRVQFPSMVEDSIYTSAPPPTTAAPSVAAPAPGATFNGTIQPALPAWDPYANPATQAVPYSPYAPSPYAPAPFSAPGAAPYTPTPEPLYPDGAPMLFAPDGFVSSVQQSLRLLQEVRARYTWLASNGGEAGLGVDSLELSATFAVPIIYNQAPLLVTPGFAVHYFDGPTTTAALGADLPPRVYDAFLDFGWHPQIAPWLGANLGVRVGVYSDFEQFNEQSLRVMGRALGVLTFTERVQIAAGVVYLDRISVKMLPAGGIIYTPTPDARYEFLFPNPKLARRWTTYGTTEIWYYLGGEYGGGSWTIERINPLAPNDAIDYNDIRVFLGIETIAASGMRGTFEVGYVFNREVVYRSGFPERFEPNDTIMLRAGLAF